MKTVIGKSKGACLSGKKANFDFDGFNVTDYYGGCLYASKLKSFKLRNSHFNNANFSSIYSKSIEYSDMRGATFTCSKCDDVLIEKSTFDSNVNMTEFGAGVIIEGGDED